MGKKTKEKNAKKKFNDEEFLNKYDVHWHEMASQLEALQNDKTLSDPEKILEIKIKAENLYKNMAKNYEDDFGSSKADKMWLKTVLKSGTLVDKMSAYTLIIQDSSIHRLKTMEILLNHATKKNRRESLAALDTFKELFLNGLLPDRTLVPFHKQPLGDPNVRDVHLIYWYFEDSLKTIVNGFLIQLEKLSHDTVLNTKKKVQSIAYELLKEKTEGQEKLLSILVNKFGDSEKKIASNSTYLLTLLQEKHPEKKLMMAKEVEMFLHRNRVSLKAQYYAVIFLNQIILTRNNIELSKKLLSIYFSMFKQLTLQHKNLESKMLGALLTGVNRAFPFAPAQPKEFEEQMNILFKLIHISSFNKSAQALLLVFQVMYAQNNVTDRFYRALYEKILSPDLLTSSRQRLFLNVLFKAMKHDKNLERVKAFVKRCLQITFYSSPAFACGMLFLISELLKVKKELKEMITGREPTEKGEYDPFKREPIYSNADKVAWWELVVLSKHFHPSVAKWANILLEGEHIEYNGDPLKDFSLIAFLDRFILKKPKKSKETLSKMANRYETTGVRSLLVNNKEFLELEEDEIPEDEIFFHKYFKAKAMSNLKKESKSKEIEEGQLSDDESMDDSESDIPGMSDIEESDDEENIDIEKKLEKILIEDEGEDEDEEDNLDGDVFASVEEFQHLLEGSGKDDKLAKQLEWEERFNKKRKRSSVKRSITNKKKKVK